MLPAGWVSNAAAQGAAKDANIRLIFIDASNIVGPDNRVLGKGKDLDVRGGRKLPFTLGHEIVGTVEALGPEATGVAAIALRNCSARSTASACVICASWVM